MTPTVNVIAQPNGGSVQPGTTIGTLVLANAGTRSVTGGTSLGGTSSFSAGIFTLTGTPGDTYTITNTSGSTITLKNGSNTSETMKTAAVTLSSTGGTFPASPGTTGDLTIGLTVNVGTSSTDQTGTYTGTLSLKIQDTTPHPAKTVTQAFTITLKVDDTPITISNSASLGFGAVFPSATAGTVVMSPAGTRTFTGGVTLGMFNQGNAARFTVGGVDNATYAITLPASCTLTSGSYQMTVDTFTSSPSGTGVLSASGQQTLTVGATVHVDVSQSPGTYNGTFTLTVAYN